MPASREAPAQPDPSTAPSGTPGAGNVAPGSDSSAALVVRNLSKAFNERPALRAAGLDVRAGEVHGLVGQNGCGKSTLIKILAGYHEPDPGAEAAVYGNRFGLGDRGAAHAAGLRFIHQDLGLVGELSAVDNLALGESYTTRWWLSDRRERRAARALLAEYAVDIDVDAPVRTLSPAQQTFVAIVRALRGGLDGGNVLVLDEPTAALPDSEVQHLFGLLRGLRTRGVAIVLVTHRLSEILDLADRVTVMRDGRTITTCDVDGLSHDALAELIIGRSVEAFYPSTGTSRTEPVLRVEGVHGGGVAGASLTLHSGELVGVAGVVGSGYEDLLGLIFGARRRGGTVHLADVAVGPSPWAAVRAGIAYAPADRKRLSALVTWTLRENITLPSLRSRFAGWLSERAESSETASWLHRVQVNAEPERGFWTLSGGNQQRVVLARWLRHNARVMLLDEPTNGVDIGARHAIYEALAAAKKNGTAILAASSDVEELAAICDRVLVMRDGEIAAELDRDQLAVDTILAESLKPGGTDQ
ncbi:sugar ABC transporter ATP-binding protein [Spirillospora sp. CA-255316]